LIEIFLDGMVSVVLTNKRLAKYRVSPDLPEKRCLERGGSPRLKQPLRSAKCRRLSLQSTVNMNAVTEFAVTLLWPASSRW
jgi:hypothetical protein